MTMFTRFPARDTVVTRSGGALLIGSLLTALLLFPAVRPVAARSNIADRTERLVVLCKLWAKVKYFHPTLAYRRDIDWDRVLIEAIPSVTAAGTTEEFQAALAIMLSKLDDPLTRVATNGTVANESSPKREFGFSLNDQGVLVVTAGNYYDLYNASVQQKLPALAEAAGKARIVIFDLRSDIPLEAFGAGALTSTFSGLERHLIANAFETPGERSRLYYGFESGGVFSSGQYRSGFFTKRGNTVAPLKGSREVPVVTILNRNSGLLDSSLPLQRNGQGMIVYEGYAGESAFGGVDTLDLADGISADVRVSELIFDDGSAADVTADAYVSPADNDNDPAMQKALALANDFHPSETKPRHLPARPAYIRDSSYADMQFPAIEYRLLAAFRIWAVVNYFHPYKDLIDQDWEGVLREFIPRFEVAKDALEYSLTVAEMVTRMHDSHSYVAGKTLNTHFGTGYPPIRVRVIEGKLVVTQIFDADAARAAGLNIGDIVEKVDGEDARARFERYAKYISASTPQSLDDKASLSFMNGAEGSTVSLIVSGANNVKREVKLVRRHEDYTTLYHRERSGPELRSLPGNIGYADLDRLTGDRIDELLEKFKDTKGIILDMRGYPNGIFYWMLAPRLTMKTDLRAALIETPLIGQNTSDRSSEAFYQMVPPRQPGQSVYTGKTIMLIDERSESQAEHTGLFFKAANGTVFVGRATAGADGEVTTFGVPGGITIGFTGQSVRHPDGRQLQRKGLIPDVPVKPTIKGIREGRDEILEKAIKFLN